jgi:hypothetical protein
MTIVATVADSPFTVSRTLHPASGEQGARLTTLSELPHLYVPLTGGVNDTPYRPEFWSDTERSGARSGLCAGLHAALDGST